MLLLAVSAASHTFTVDVSQPALRPVEGLYEIAIPGMHPLENNDGVSLPGDYIFYPVPPGSIPELKWTVEAVGRTGWSSEVNFSSEPVLTGYGFNTSEDRVQAAFPEEHQPVAMDVVHLLGSTVARISVSPFCYGSPGMFASRLSITLTYPDRSGGISTEGTLFSHLSPEADRWWRYRTRSEESPFWGKPWARIRVDASGFYSVTGQEIIDAGCDITGAPSPSLAMFSGPATMFDPLNPADSQNLYPVSISVHDGDDGFFDPQDSLVFYGRELWHWSIDPDSIYRSYHRFDTANTYWLTWGGDNGERIEQRSAASSGGFPLAQGIVPFAFEEEILSDYQNIRTGWVWDYLRENSPGYFYLSSPVNSDDATLRLGLTNSGSAGNTYHTVTAELEDVIILDTLCRSTRNHTIAVEGVSVESGGGLLKVWDDFDGSAYLDFAEFMIPVNLTASAGYPVYFMDIPSEKVSLSIGPVSSASVIYDLTDQLNPVELSDWTLDEDQALLSTAFAGGYGFVQATSPAFFKSVQSIVSAQPGRVVGSSLPAQVLVALPEEFSGYIPVIESVYSLRNLSICAATYREIYDEFGQGISDPGAVRSFVRWALDTWPDPPEMLLLIGDGSDDPLGITTGYPTNSPIYVQPGTELCYESFFTTVHTGSIFPEIPYYRIPATTEDELAVVLQKSADLADPSTAGPWGNNVVLAADDEWGGSGLIEYEHTETCEAIADSVLPGELNIVKHYLIEYSWPAGTTGEGVHPFKPEASQDFIELLNSGVSSISFFGHGSYDQMAEEKLFASSMTSQLENGPRYFQFFSFSCYNGNFVLSSGDCLSEIILNHPNGGAIVAISCTGSSQGGQNKTLSEFLLGNLYGQEQLSSAEAFWVSVVDLQYGRNLEYAVLGDGAVTPPMGETELSSIDPPGSLLRGQVNSVEVEFPEESFFRFRCMESADTVHYVSPLTGNIQIDYLRLGSAMYNGIVTTNEQGSAVVEFFVPLQADTGSMGRTDATGVCSGILRTAYAWPLAVTDNGNYADDTDGPEIDVYFPDEPEGSNPSVWQNSVLHAELSDPSGICVLGNNAGSIIMCSIDGQYDDVTELFSFNTGSYTSGSFDYTLPDLLPGQHQLRVVARDGMKNTGETELNFTVLEGEPPLLEDTGVYPNPSRGTRAFFFTAGSSGTVSVQVFTITGRPVWQAEKTVGSGAGQIIWDGCDADGDSPAAGTYIYRLTLHGGSDSVSETDLLVVSP